MIKKITTALNVLKKGQVVADPAKWKGRQVTTTVLVSFLWAVIEAARAFGYEIPVDAEAVDSIAVGVIAVVNVMLTYTTSDKVGV